MVPGFFLFLLPWWRSRSIAIILRPQPRCLSPHHEADHLQHPECGEVAKGSENRLLKSALGDVSCLYRSLDLQHQRSDECWEGDVRCGRPRFLDPLLYLARNIHTCGADGTSVDGPPKVLQAIIHSSSTTSVDPWLCSVHCNVRKSPALAVATPGCSVVPTTRTWQCACILVDQHWCCGQRDVARPSRASDVDN